MMLLLHHVPTGMACVGELWDGCLFEILQKMDKAAVTGLPFPHSKDPGIDVN